MNDLSTEGSSWDALGSGPDLEYQKRSLRPNGVSSGASSASAMKDKEAANRNARASMGNRVWLLMKLSLRG